MDRHDDEKTKGTVRITVPPGFNILLISFAKMNGSRKCSITSEANMQSKWLDTKGRGQSVCNNIRTFWNSFNIKSNILVCLLKKDTGKDQYQLL